MSSANATHRVRVVVVVVVVVACECIRGCAPVRFMPHAYTRAFVGRVCPSHVVSQVWPGPFERNASRRSGW